MTKEKSYGEWERKLPSPPCPYGAPGEHPYAVWGPLCPQSPLTCCWFPSANGQLSERVAGKKCFVPPPPMTTTALSHYESLQSHPSSLEVSRSLQALWEPWSVRFHLGPWQVWLHIQIKASGVPEGGFLGCCPLQAWLFSKQWNTVIWKSRHSRYLGTL